MTATGQEWVTSATGPQESSPQRGQSGCLSYGWWGRARGLRARQRERPQAQSREQRPRGGAGRSGLRHPAPLSPGLPRAAPRLCAAALPDARCSLSPTQLLGASGLRSMPLLRRALRVLQVRPSPSASPFLLCSPDWAEISRECPHRDSPRHLVSQVSLLCAVTGRR